MAFHTREAQGVIVGLAAFCLVLLTEGIADAQIATLDERVAGAETIVVATARAVTAEWRENQHGDRLIVSRVQLDVEETMKGAADRTMWMEMEGGTIDGLTLQVSSLPLVVGGERAVFFLDRGPGTLRVPHLKGQGILFLDDRNVVRGSSLRLDEIRTHARGGGR
jgi:hypothetical protein